MTQGSPDRDRPPEELMRRMAPAPLPARPTRAVPGSDTKIRIMAMRARNGLALFHPDDARGNPADDVIDQDTWLPPLVRLPAGLFQVSDSDINSIEAPHGNT